MCILQSFLCGFLWSGHWYLSQGLTAGHQLSFMSLSLNVILMFKGLVEYNSGGSDYKPPMSVGKLVATKQHNNSPTKNKKCGGSFTSQGVLF